MNTYPVYLQEMTEPELRQLKTAEDPETGAASQDSDPQIKLLERQDQFLKHLIECAVISLFLATLL